MGCSEEIYFWLYQLFELIRSWLFVKYLQTWDPIKYCLQMKKENKKDFQCCFFLEKPSVFKQMFLRPTSNRASIRYGCPIRCFQFVRLQSKVSRIQTYSQALTFWLRMRVRIIGFKTKDRTTVSYRHSIMSMSAF